MTNRVPKWPALVEPSPRVQAKEIPVRSENPLEADAVVDIEVRTYETDLPFLRLVASNG